MENVTSWLRWKRAVNNEAGAIIVEAPRACQAFGEKIYTRLKVCFSVDNRLFFAGGFMPLFLSSRTFPSEKRVVYFNNAFKCRPVWDFL
jgi:hypothetical protein